MDYIFGLYRFKIETVKKKNSLEKIKVLMMLINRNTRDICNWYAHTYKSLNCSCAWIDKNSEYYFRTFKKMAKLNFYKPVLNHLQGVHWGHLERFKQK